MKKPIGKLVSLGLMLLLLSVSISGCGQNWASGTVQISITDSPGLEFDHIWITVKEVWFHASDASGPHEAGWLKFPLSEPVTIDLAALTNGELAEVFDNLTLPVGHYQQIRLFLASTEDELTASAADLGLLYNNQVEFTDPDDGVRDVPLRLPGPGHGLKLIGTFRVTVAETLRLVIDFDAGHDIVKHLRGTHPEFILKPRLRYFDLDNAGAIAGEINTDIFKSDSNPDGGYNFVIKAEELSEDGTHHTVARATTVKADGTFLLYPLPVPADSSTKNYDIVLRGRNVETSIIKDVPVTKGTTPTSGPTGLTASPITMVPGSEYTVNLDEAIDPTGSWIHFYQTLPGEGEAPYEIRFRHVNPFTGKFIDDIDLSSGELHAGNYNNGDDISFTAVHAVDGSGSFSAAAEAFLYERSVSVLATPPGSGTGTVYINFPPLTVKPPAAGNEISGRLNIPSSLSGELDKGFIIVSIGGRIVTTLSIDTILEGNGGDYTVPNLPGGTETTPLKGAFYTLYALGWDSARPLTFLAAAIPKIADLRTGSDTHVDMTMVKVRP